MQRFDDRFTYANPALAAANFETITDAQLEALSPELKEMSRLVRGRSVLLGRKTTREIYNTITQQADATISLYLAAARDNLGLRLFPDLEAVKQVMFGPTATATQYVNPERNIFVQGLRKVAVDLTASILIGQLASIPEQEKHASYLEQQALTDLKRILEIPDLTAGSQTSAGPDTDSGAFYFRPDTLTLTTALRAEVFMPSLVGATTWQPVATYTGSVTVAEIVADIADAINALTLDAKSTNLLAAPILSGSNAHILKVHARSRDTVVGVELISIRFRWASGAQLPVPLIWGTQLDQLAPQPLNSLLLSVAQGRTASVASSATQTAEPIVLYLRRAETDSSGNVLTATGSIMPRSTWSNANLSFRISPTMETALTVPLTTTTSTDPDEQLRLDKQRPGQLALLLLNQLFVNKTQTRALGALIRNDPETDVRPLAAVELIAFSLTSGVAWIILDLLELPPDLEVAIGDRTRPLTSFASKPRSIRVETTLLSGVSSSATSGVTSSFDAATVTLTTSSRLQSALDRSEVFKEWQGGYFHQ